MDTRKILKVIQGVIEELWKVFVIIWNTPIGLIELAWTYLFNKESFRYNVGLLKQAIRRNNGRGNGKVEF